jgi:hypothetical protein
LFDMRRRLGFRWWAVAWAVLQFALPAAATFADARLERESASAQGPHVESRSDASCRPVHTAECALCQVVSRASTPAVQRHDCVATLSVIQPPVIAVQSWHARGGPARLAPARAPPLA